VALPLVSCAEAENKHKKRVMARKSSFFIKEVFISKNFTNRTIYKIRQKKRALKIRTLFFDLLLVKNIPDTDLSLPP
jgi:hypothetical protein